MAKLTLTDLTSLQNENSVVTAINDNNAALEAAVEKTLSRDGTSPNSMNAVLDMNSNRIINLPTPEALNDPVRVVDVQGDTFTVVIADGEVTTAKLADHSVTNAKMATVPAASLKGNTSASTADVQDISVSALADIGVIDATADKLVIYDASSGTLKSTKPFSFNGSGTYRTLKDAASFTLTSADANTTIFVDTQGSVAQGEISVYLPAISTLPAGAANVIHFKKVNTNTHPGKMVVRPPTTAATTASGSASASTITVASATGIAIGQAVIGIGSSTYRREVGIQPQTKVTNIAGTTITLSKALLTTFAGQTVHFLSETIDGDGARAFEIPGQSLTLVSDGVSDWKVLDQNMATLATPISGHHTVPGTTYSVSNPWPADPATANTQMWEFVPESGTPTEDLKVNMPHPNLLADGYTPSMITLRRSDSYANYFPVLYTPNASWDQSDSNTYPIVLEDWADIYQVYTDGGEFQIMGHYDAHKSGICDLAISGSTSPSVVSYPSGVSTIYLIPKSSTSGDRIALPSSTAATSQVWWIRRMQDASLSLSLSAPAYGYSASANATHNVYVWSAPTGRLKLILGAANQGTNELVKLDNCFVNSTGLTGGVSAKAARWVGTIVTNGSSNAIIISDTTPLGTYFFTGYPNTGTSAARIGINTPSPSTGNPTMRLYAAYPDAYSQFEMSGSGLAQSDLYVDTTQFNIGTIGSFPVNLKSANTARLTIAADGGVYTPSATGGSKGSNTINASTVYSGGYKTNVVLSAQSAGSTNNSSSGSGSYASHTPTFAIPANTLTQNKLLKVKLMFLITTGSAAPTLAYKVRLGGTDVLELTGNTPANGLTSRLYMTELDLLAIDAPGASANTATGLVANANGFANTVTFNNIAQPVALATNGSLTLDVQTKWGSAGTGTNTIQLYGLVIEAAN